MIPHVLELMEVSTLVKQGVINFQEVQTLPYGEVCQLAKDRQTHRQEVDNTACREGVALKATRQWRGRIL